MALRFARHTLVFHVFRHQRGIVWSLLHGSSRWKIVIPMFSIVLEGKIPLKIVGCKPAPAPKKSFPLHSFTRGNHLVAAALQHWRSRLGWQRSFTSFFGHQCGAAVYISLLPPSAKKIDPNWLLHIPSHQPLKLILKNLGRATKTIKSRIKSSTVIKACCNDLTLLHMEDEHSGLPHF
jgi:hypothetical protein